VTSSRHDKLPDDEQTGNFTKHEKEIAINNSYLKKFNLHVVDNVWTFLRKIIQVGGKPIKHDAQATLTSSLAIAERPRCS